MKRKLLALFLAVVMCFSLLPFEAFAEVTVIDSGTCGSSVTWTLDSKGELSIKGKGAMKNFDDPPWYDYNYMVESVSIGKGVTRIGESAFKYCENLTSVSISNSVTIIGEFAFYHCSDLMNVEIPNSVISIGKHAFRGCNNLTSVTIPDSVKSIGNSAFEECDSLTSVTIGNGVTGIGFYAFGGCSSLTSITIPNKVTIIEPGTFQDCTSLKKITIPDSVKIIDYSAFENCGSLKNVYYSGTKAQWGKIDISSLNNDCLKRATIHYEANKPLAPSVSISNVASSGKIKLSWKAVAGAEKYEVYRATSSDGTYKKLGTTTKTSYTNTSATAGTKYYYKVRALSAAGTAGSYSSVKNIICDLAQPVVTLSNVASSGKIKVSWDKVTDASKYEVYRATSSDGTYKKLTSTTSTSYTDTSASAGSKYYYKVKAICSKTSDGNSAYSAVKNAYCDLARPTVTLSTVASSGKVKLTWKAVEGATKYEIYRATSKTGTYTKLYTTTKTSYTNSSAKPGTTYYYKVKAIAEKSAANSAYSAIKYITCDCAKPVVKITTSSGHPKLTWSKIDGATKYEIYRATSKTGTYTKMTTVTGTSYTNTSAKAGTTYYYKVIAVGSKSAANSAYSTVVSIKAK